MSVDTPKASSCLEDGAVDGWVPEAGYQAEVDPQGRTRIVVTAPVERLPSLHDTLIATLQAPLSVLYRQKVDRRDPKPEGAPPRDFVAVDLPVSRVQSAFEAAADLIYRDARCEVWVKGGLGEQLVLDTDGVLYVYPDDPAFRDALIATGLTEIEVVTLEDRDYVRHWFHASCDALEDGLQTALGLVEVPHRK